jgi:transposase
MREPLHAEAARPDGAGRRQSIFASQDFNRWGLVLPLVFAGNVVVATLACFLVGFLIRSFNPKLKAAAERLGTLRTPQGEPIPPNTLAALKRDLERHQIVKKQIREIEQTRLEHLAQAPAKGPNAMVLLLARVVGIGVETADMLVQEVLSRTMRDRRAVGRYAGLTGSPDESGAKTA